MKSFKLICVIIVISLKIEYTKTIQGEHPYARQDSYGRAELLKQMIRDEIREEQEGFLQGMMKKDDDRSLEQKDEEEQTKTLRFTPIMRITEESTNKTIKTGLVSTLPTSSVSSVTTSNTEIFNLKPLRTSIRKKKKKKKAAMLKRVPSEIFYRRDLDHTLNYPIREMHCLDLLAPYLMGEKGNGTFKIIRVNDRIVIRLIQLISEDVSRATRDDIYCLLEEISKVNIRLFQWDDMAMQLLFNQIIPGRAHSLRHLKYGLQSLLEKWHLDYGNVTNLLHQTKVFRPPCIQTSELSGSTKTSKATRYPKVTPPKKECPPTDDECNEDEDV